MNEHDSKKAHEKRDADAKRIAAEYAQSCGLVHTDALEYILQHAWEHGFDFAKGEASK